MTSSMRHLLRVLLDGHSLFEVKPAKISQLLSEAYETLCSFGIREVKGSSKPRQFWQAQGFRVLICGRHSAQSDDVTEEDPMGPSQEGGAGRPTGFSP